MCFFVYLALTVCDIMSLAVSRFDAALNDCRNFIVAALQRKSSAGDVVIVWAM